MRRAPLVAAAILLFGCDGRSFVRVLVDGIPAGAERLDATVENAGDRAGPYGFPLAGKLAGSSFDFSLSFAPSRSGAARIQVDAVQGQAVMARGEASPTIVPGGVTTATVHLSGAPPPDMAGPGPDLGAPDLATPPDLAPGRDLATAPDLLPPPPPFDTNGLRAWFRADVGVTTVMNTTSVFEWADSSGSGRHASQPNSRDQPHLVQNVVNGKPAVRFDGNGRFLLFDGTFLPNKNYSVVLVEARSRADAGWPLVGGQYRMNQGLALAYANNTTLRYSQYMNDLERPIPGYTVPELNVTTAVFDGAAGHFLYRRGLAPVSNNDLNPLSGPFQQLSIGGTFFVWYSGDVAELLMFDVALTQQQRQGIDAYLKQKYALP